MDMNTGNDMGFVKMEGKSPFETEEQTQEMDAATEEERKRAEHEAEEARRKAEWDAGQQAKKKTEQEKLDQLAAMNDDEAVDAAMRRVGADTEKLTRRNMKDCVAEYIQTKCLEEPAFARLVMHPRKSMINCFHYINRKAREWIEQEMKDNDIERPVNGVYGSDVPDDLCYQWAEDYFRDLDAEEDRVKEEKFVSRPYASGGRSKTRTGRPQAKRETAKPQEPQKEEKEKPSESAKTDAFKQISLMDVLMQENAVPQEQKVG